MILLKEKISSIIFPNNKITIYIISFFIIGLISGSLFLTNLDSTDKLTIITRIKDFLTNNNLSLKNTLIINYTYITLIYIFGLTLLGLFINSIISYIKGFILGFSISSIFYTYGIKSILMGIIYIFPHNIINIIIIISLTVYSIIFSAALIKQIIGKRVNILQLLKKYTVIYLSSLILITISSLYEVYITPFLYDLITKLYS